MSSTPKKLHFHDDSRKAFSDEKPVIDAVEQARTQVGYALGAALFENSSYGSAAPTEIPRAVDIIRYGMSDAVKRARTMGYMQHVVTGTYEKHAVHSGTEQDNPEVSDSLQRMGFAG